MILLEFIEKTDLNEKAEIYKAKLLCFYSYKESSVEVFSMPEITDLFIDAGYNKPNISRLKKNLLSSRIMKGLSKDVRSLSFVPTTIQSLIKEYGALWIDDVNIASNNEILDENKFCGKRGYLDNLIKQINSTYKNNCYDASAVLMRRLFEIALILTYREFGIDTTIKDSSGNYEFLDKIIKDSKVNPILNISRIKSKYTDFQKTGNFSAHRIEYIASKRDIDNISIDYRAALEELFLKAKL